MTVRERLHVELSVGLTPGVPRQQAPSRAAATWEAWSEDEYVAYQVVGDGPLDLVQIA